MRSLLDDPAKLVSSQNCRDVVLVASMRDQRDASGSRRLLVKNVCPEEGNVVGVDWLATHPGHSDHGLEYPGVSRGAFPVHLIRY